MAAKALMRLQRGTVARVILYETVGHEQRVTRPWTLDRGRVGTGVGSSGRRTCGSSVSHQEVQGTLHRLRDLHGSEVTPFSHPPPCFHFQSKPRGRHHEEALGSRRSPGPESCL